MFKNDVIWFVCFTTIDLIPVMLKCTDIYDAV